MGSRDIHAADPSWSSKNLTSGALLPKYDSFNLSNLGVKGLNKSIQHLDLGSEKIPLFLHILSGVSKDNTTDGMMYLGIPLDTAIPNAGWHSGRGKSTGRYSLSKEVGSTQSPPPSSLGCSTLVKLWSSSRTVHVSHDLVRVMGRFWSTVCPLIAMKGAAGELDDTTSWQRAISWHTVRTALQQEVINWMIGIVVNLRRSSYNFTYVL